MHQRDELIAAIEGLADYPQLFTTPEELKVRHERRLPLYRTAHFTLVTTGLAPGEVVNRLLPGPSPHDGDEARPGWKYPSSWAPSVLTRLSDEAAVENNELRGEGAVVYGNQSPTRA